MTESLREGGTPVAPAFTLERLDGTGELSLASLRGQAVVLNFWASWCGPCKEETPLLQAASELAGEGRDFVGVDVKDFRGDARDFLARYGVTYPNVYDGKGSTVGRYGVTGFPRRTSSTRRAGCATGSRARRGRGGDRRRDRASASRRRERSRSPSRRSSSRRPPPRARSGRRPELESELVCPVCETTLDTSNAPVALRMKAFIRERIAAGDTKSEIKAQLVDQFGPTVLAVPPRKGFDWIAWLLPLAGLAVGAVLVGVLAALEPAARRGVARRRGRAARPRARAPAGRRARPLQ